MTTANTLTSFWQNGATFDIIAALQAAAACDLWFFYTAIPLVMCLIGVHLIFKHFLTFVWWSVKILLAGVIYLHVRDAISPYIVTDPLSIESTLLGVPAGTIKLAASIGFDLVKTRSLVAVAAACPNCFPLPLKTVQEEDTKSPWGTWVENTLVM